MRLTLLTSQCLVVVGRKENLLENKNIIRNLSLELFFKIQDVLTSLVPKKGKSKRKVCKLVSVFN